MMRQTDEINTASKISHLNCQRVTHHSQVCGNKENCTIHRVNDNKFLQEENDHVNPKLSPWENRARLLNAFVDKI